MKPQLQSAVQSSKFPFPFGHLLLGFLIGAAVNLAVQFAGLDSALHIPHSAFYSHLDLLELAACASVASLAAFTTALLQRPTAPFHSGRLRPVASADRSHRQVS